MIRWLLFVTLLYTAFGYAWARGGWSERAAATLYLAAVLATHVLIRPLAERFQHLEAGLLMLDVAVLVGFVAIAVWSDRFWPLLASAMQAVVVISHGAILASPGVIAWTYGNAIALWSYPILILIVAGTRRQAVRRRTARTQAEARSAGSSDPISAMRAGTAPTR